MRILKAIKNSMIELGALIILVTLRAKDTECPTVNAVIKMKSFFQSLNGKVTTSKLTNKIWSKPLRSKICCRPILNHNQNSFIILAEKLKLFAD